MLAQRGELIERRNYSRGELLTETQCLIHECKLVSSQQTQLNAYLLYAIGPSSVALLKEFHFFEV